MSLNRMPLFVWAMLVVRVMVIFAMPAVMVSSTCLILDRLMSTHFFNQAEGGDRCSGSTCSGSSDSPRSTSSSCPRLAYIYLHPCAP